MSTVTPLQRAGSSRTFAAHKAPAVEDIFLPQPDKALYSMELEADDVKVSAVCMQGWRNTMEDAHAVHLNLVPGVHLIAVFDGHGGAETAQKAAEALAGWIVKSPSFASGHYDEALKDAYIVGDHELCMAMSNSGAKSSGSTAVSVIIANNKIYCANVGDSRAVLCRGNKAVDLSTDHKPSLRREAERVINAGGQIINGRVRGMLAMTRALGDPVLKRLDVRAENLAVTPVPEITITDITEDDVAIILACDGIWDCTTSQEVCEFFLEENTEHDDWALMCETLCHAVVAPGIHQFGTDNMTIVTIRFRKHHASHNNSNTTTTNLLDDGGLCMT